MNEPLKSCTKCGEAKPLTEYHRRAASRDGYRPLCKACAIAYQRARYDSRRDQEVAGSKSRYETNRDARLAYAKRYHAERLTSDPKYRARRKAAELRRRRLLALAVQEPYLRDEIFERDGWICQLCNEPISPEVRFPGPASATIDHIVPISLGGDDTPANVQAAHYRCNASKGNKTKRPPPAL